MHNFSWIDNYEELTDDLFVEDISEVAQRSKDLMFVEKMVVTCGNEHVVTSGLIQIDLATKEMSVGYSEEQRVNYSVYTDTTPAFTVLNFMKAHFNSGLMRFPHVEESRPVCPPSRYPKAEEFYEFYEFWIGCRFKILHPTSAQRKRFPASCVDVYDETHSYVVNNKEDFFIAGIQAVMLDFNPYYPGSVKYLKSVTVDKRGIRYTREWKDNLLTGMFDYNLKRYHFDVWSQVAMTPRKKEGWVYISNYDLIVTDYNLFESRVSIMNNGYFRGYVEKEVFSDNIFVDPYDVKKPHRLKFRSNLNRANFPGSSFVPWTTRGIRNKCSFENEDISFYRFVEDRIYNFLGEEIDLGNIHKLVRDREEMNKRDSRVNLDQKLANFARRVFVRHKKVSIYDGQEVRKDGLSKSDFDGAYILDRSGKDKFMVVPYKIARYPNNGKSTLLPCLETFTLEEFLGCWEREFLKFKFPPWLYMNEGVETVDYVSIEKIGGVCDSTSEHRRYDVI